MLGKRFAGTVGNVINRRGGHVCLNGSVRRSSTVVSTEAAIKISNPLANKKQDKKTLARQELLANSDNVTLYPRITQPENVSSFSSIHMKYADLEKDVVLNSDCVTVRG